MKRRLLRLYRGSGFIGLTTPRFNVILIRTWVWLYPGWWFWGNVAGSWILRAGPMVLTVWKPIKKEIQDA